MTFQLEQCPTCQISLFKLYFSYYQCLNPNCLKLDQIRFNGYYYSNSSYGFNLPFQFNDQILIAHLTPNKSYIQLEHYYTPTSIIPLPNLLPNPQIIPLLTKYLNLQAFV